MGHIFPTEMEAKENHFHLQWVVCLRTDGRPFTLAFFMNLDSLPDIFYIFQWIPRLSSLLRLFLCVFPFFSLITDFFKVNFFPSDWLCYFALLIWPLLHAGLCSMLPELCFYSSAFIGLDLTIRLYCIIPWNFFILQFRFTCQLHARLFVID